jgi:lysyl-tRNA synthetase class II
VDGKFIEALKFGMPPSGGNALGVDRLVMLLVGEEDIRNVLYLPYRDL